MLLLRQLPASSMSSISSIRFPSFDAVTFPSYTSILLSLLASLVLLSLLRAVTITVCNGLSKRSQQQQPTPAQVENKSEEHSQSLQRRRSLWSWSMPKMDSLPAVTLSLPVSLNAMEKDTFGKGVGLQQQKREERRREVWAPPRIRSNGRGPAFETPLPALYQSQPVSMAKIIMSRHTYRRPTSRPPPRAAVCQHTRKLVSPPPSPPPPSETPSPSSSSNHPSMV